MKEGLERRLTIVRERASSVNLEKDGKSKRKLGSGKMGISPKAFIGNIDSIMDIIWEEGFASFADYLILESRKDVRFLLFKEVAQDQFSYK